MKGTIPDIWADDAFEVEFLDNEGFNYEYDNQATFTVNASDIKPADPITRNTEKSKTMHL